MHSDRANILIKIGSQDDADRTNNDQGQSWQVILADENFIEKDDGEEDLNDDGCRTIEG